MMRVLIFASMLVFASQASRVRSRIASPEAQPRPKFSAPDGLSCLGEFLSCPNGSCAFFEENCGICGDGEYVCPDLRTCVAVSEWTRCPSLPDWFDESLPIGRRVSSLVGNMTLAEKIGQMNDNARAIPRLSIPSYEFLSDDEHGVKQHEATSFPNGNALGASWDADLLLRVGTAIGVEARGIHNGRVHGGDRGAGQNGEGITLYAPNLNLVRNPLWGRAQEVFSEDPVLTGQLTKSYVMGMQGAAVDNNGRLLTGACCKHYAAYDLEGPTPAGRKNYSANVDARNMWETYMPAFEACVAEAKGSHVMCSYNSINGVPTCADPKLLNDILRGRFGFEGFVVSDYDAWADLVSTHFVCPGMECAAALGLNAGMDQEGGGTVATDALPQALAANLTTMAAVDAAVSRIMTTRFLLGMFDPPTSVPANLYGNSTEWVASAAHIALAREAAQKAIALYRNRNGALPLSPQATRKIAVIGPQANMTELLQGNYAVTPNAGIVTVLDGLRGAFPRTEIVHHLGCLTIECGTAIGFKLASLGANGADAIVVTLGLDQTIEREGLDRSTLDLPGLQYALVSYLRKEHPSAKLVCVLIHGGTIAMKNLLGDCDALVDAFYPSQQGGNAIADVLSGRVSPAGRAAVTSYSSTSDLPPMGQADLYAGNGITYRYYSPSAPAPTVPFGFGLSYTTFGYSSLQAPAAVGPCSPFNVTFTVTNTGSVLSDEVAQVYVTQTNRTRGAVPNIRLAAFQRLHNLAPGERRQVSLVIPVSVRGTVINDSKNIYDPVIVYESGDIILKIGGSQDGPLKTMVQILHTAEKC